MPLDVVNIAYRVAVDEPYDGAVQPKAIDRTLAPLYARCRRTTTNECCPFPRAVFATVEEIRYASELRLLLRDRYLRRPEPLIGPWCVGAD